MSSKVHLEPKYIAMVKLIGPPKSLKLLVAHPVSMHDETTQWISELEFYKLEMDFMQNLLNKFFLQFSAKRNLNNFVKVEEKLKAFHKKYYKQMHDDITKHEHNLSELDKDMFAKARKEIVAEHKKHKTGMKAFMASVKKIKSEIYKLIGDEIKREKGIKNENEDRTLAL